MKTSRQQGRNPNSRSAEQSTESSSNHHNDEHVDSLAPTEISTASLGRLAQARLEVGTSNDPAEIEAESMADAFVAGHRSVQRLSRPDDSIRRASADSVTSDELAAGGFAVGADAERAISTAGPGRPLPESLQDSLGGFLGADLSNVRIHADKGAAEVSRSLGAEAFTVGNDVFFGADAYDPGSRTGQHLIAHEVTHTVQQGAVRRTGISRQLPSDSSSGNVVHRSGSEVVRRQPSSDAVVKAGKEKAAEELKKKQQELAGRISTETAKLTASRHQLQAAKDAEPRQRLQAAENVLAASRQTLRLKQRIFDSMQVDESPQLMAALAKSIQDLTAGIEHHDKEIARLRDAWFLFESNREKKIQEQETGKAEKVGIKDRESEDENAQKARIETEKRAKEASGREVDEARRGTAEAQANVEERSGSPEVREANQKVEDLTVSVSGSESALLDLGNQDAKLTRDLATLDQEIAALERNLVAQLQSSEAFLENMENAASTGALVFSNAVGQTDGWYEVGEGGGSDAGGEASSTTQGLAVAGIISSGINILLTFNKIRLMSSADKRPTKEEMARLGVDVVTDFTELAKTILTWQKTVDAVTGSGAAAIPVLGSIVSAVSVVMTVIERVRPLHNSNTALRDQLAVVKGKAEYDGKGKDIAALNSLLGRNNLNLSHAWFDVAMDLTMIAGSIASATPAAPVGAALLAGAAAAKLCVGLFKWGYDVYQGGNAGDAEAAFVGASIADPESAQAKELYLKMLEKSSHASYRRIIASQLILGDGVDLKFLKGLGLSQAFITSTAARAKAEWDDLEATKKAQPGALESLKCIDWSVAMEQSSAMLSGGQARRDDRSISKRFQDFMTSIWNWRGSNADSGGSTTGSFDSDGAKAAFKTATDDLSSKWLAPYAQHKDVVPWKFLGFGPAISSSGVKKRKVKEYSDLALKGWVKSYGQQIAAQAPAPNELLQNLEKTFVDCLNASLRGAPAEDKMRDGKINRITKITVDNFEISGTEVTFKLVYEESNPVPVPMTANPMVTVP